jgi:hypothetical protein
MPEFGGRGHGFPRDSGSSALAGLKRVRRSNVPGAHWSYGPKLVTREGVRRRIVGVFNAFSIKGVIRRDRD